MPNQKSIHTGPTNSAWTRMTGKQKIANILKNTKPKSTHTCPTNSAGKSFSNRSEFTLVAVGKGLIAQSVES